MNITKAIDFLPIAFVGFVQFEKLYFTALLLLKKTINTPQK
mgnify:CR=1 FL=1